MSLFATDIDEEFLTEKIQLEAAIEKINAKIAKEVSKYVSNDKFPQFKISIRESEDDGFEQYIRKGNIVAIYSKDVYSNIEDVLESILNCKPIDSESVILKLK